MFHINKSILVGLTVSVVRGTLPGKRESRNFGFLHQDKFQNNLLFCRDLTCILLNFAIRVIRTDRLLAEITL